MESDKDSDQIGTGDSIKESAPPFVFWRRIFAYCVDFLLLGALGSVLGLCFFHFFVALGTYGKLVGFGICLVYFGFFNSAMGSGQTIGKRLLKIKVISLDGQFLPLKKSLVRAAILSLPALFNGTTLPPNLILEYLSGFVLVSLGVGLPYFFFFNIPTRRSIHDWATGSIVLRSDAGEVPLPLGLWKGHYIVLSVGAVALGIVMLVVPNLVLKPADWAELAKIQEVVNKTGYATASQVQFMTVTQMASGDKLTPHASSNKFLVINAISTQDPGNDQKSNNKLAVVVAKSIPEVMRSGLRIRLSYGYDIGIASAWKSVVTNFSANDLRDLATTGVRKTDQGNAIEQSTGH